MSSGAAQCRQLDVSYMIIVDLAWPRTRDFLRHLLANDVAKLRVPGKALYTGMLNASGGVIETILSSISFPKSSSAL